jgi:4-hydroxy-3-polyprenylbenzoate decarboxylase
MKLVIAISGASGVHLGLKIKECLPEYVEAYLIATDSAKTVLDKEQGVYMDEDISAPMASGSFGADAMIVAPCSVNTLAKIACGISDNLTTRAASVMIKERKKLLLAPREMPFSPIALENMLKLSRIGVEIMPPILGYYSDIKSLEDMERYIIGRWFDILGIENKLFKRWGSSI